MHATIMKNLFFSLLILFTALCAATPFEDVAAMNHQEGNREQENLSLGQKNLPESRKTTQLTKGVTHTEISRGYYSQNAYYTVDIAFLTSKRKAKTVAQSLRDTGYKVEIHKVKNKHTKYTDVEEKNIGYVIRSGEFTHKEEAEKLADRISDDGYKKASVTFSEFDGTTKTTGPWQIDVIEINPEKFEGELTNLLANGKIPGRETVSSMAARSKAIAGINGGYFVVGSQDGTPGDPAGISIIDGKLVSESVGDRTSLLLSNNQGEIGEVRAKLSLETSTGATEVIDGMNREPGLIRNCGGTDDKPTTKPKHDVTCTDQEEIILFSAYSGDMTPEGEGFEVVVNEEDKVVKTYPQRGHKIPENGSVLSATGEQAKWLKNAVSIGDKLRISKKVYSDGKLINTPSSLDVINGGPQLLEDGRIDIQAREEGFRWSKDFFYHFALYRHPRSFAGIKENGNILLGTVNGRNPKESIGISFFESAKILKSLGAVEGMNLDGGGSSSMVVEGQLVNDPSDTTGERPVSDGIFILK
ncbi:phosphodiester glycosidase family protein [Halobacillus naozhouensis]|uniref:Phosphodiester glycosidase family protein n=1 Tax=Halobacillus naozhouensis TaxID=554880 RepID=A0ABY8IZ35_9BACI|nr:phosphodiester glycosidase family protein [Halobacillus naozhouensis]WFT75480.1 phosphodiester glycosidase family protein [Halobacillus naozhouensis]